MSRSQRVPQRFAESAAFSEYVGGRCYPRARLPVGIFSIINREDIDDLLLLIHNVEQSELAYPISPGLRGVPLKLLDVVAPEGLRLDLGIDKGVEFPSQEGGVARRQLLETFQELIGFEYTELRQIGLAWPSRREGHS